MIISQRLPEQFTGPLTNAGTGLVVFSYGGRKIPITVIDRELDRGWNMFIHLCEIKVGAILLAAYSGGRIISILSYKKKMGMNTVWAMIGAAADVDSKLLEESEFPRSILPDVAVRTCYMPRNIALFFQRPSGVCLFLQCRCNAMVIILYLILIYSVELPTYDIICANEFCRKFPLIWRSI